MSDYLNGNINERIRDLRRKNNLTQEKLANSIGVDKSTICRIEKGETVNSEIALAIATLFGVSMDFLFGLSDNPEPRNIEIESLGVSINAAKKIISKEADADIINLLIEHNDFKKLCKAITFYLCGVNEASINVQNTIYEEISEIIGKINPDASEDVELIKADKPDEEKRIQSIFSEILKDIKSNFNNKISDTTLLTKDIIRDIEKSAGKQNFALRKINAVRLSTAVVDTIEKRYELSAEERNNLISAIIPLFGCKVRKK